MFQVKVNAPQGLPGPIIITGVSSCLGKVIVAVFIHTGTLTLFIFPGSSKDASHVEHTPTRGTRRLVLYFTTAIKI